MMGLLLLFEMFGLDVVTTSEILSKQLLLPFFLLTLELFLWSFIIKHEIRLLLLHQQHVVARWWWRRVETASSATIKQTSHVNIFFFLFLLISHLSILHGFGLLDFYCSHSSPLELLILPIDKLPANTQKCCVLRQNLVLYRGSYCLFLRVRHLHIKHPVLDLCPSFAGFLQRLHHLIM